MTTHRCIMGCDVWAIRQDTKLAGMHQFKCPQCSATFTAACVGPKPSNASWRMVRAHKEMCLACNRGYVRFLELQTDLALEIAIFKCSRVMCGYTYFLGSYLWDDFAARSEARTLRTVINDYDKLTK